MNVSWGQMPTIESSSQWRQPIIFYVSQASVGPGLARPCQYISHCNIVGNEKVLPGGWLELVGWALCPPAVMVWSEVWPSQYLSSTCCCCCGFSSRCQSSLPCLVLRVRRCHPVLSPRWSADFNCSWSEYYLHRDTVTSWVTLHHCILSSYTYI